MRESNGATSPTILLVEDEVLIRNAVAEFLRESGLRVIEASTGDQAIDILSSNMKIDLVFTDVLMPGSMDGFELVQWIRNHRPSIPLLVTSAYPGELGRAAPSGYNGSILGKPYQFENLLELICGTLASRLC